MPRPSTATALLLAALLAGAAMPLQRAAAEEDAAAPLQVRAQQASYDQRRGVIRYSGEVLILHEGLRIEADITVVQMHEGRLKRIEALGNPVRFAYDSAAEGRRGSCRKLHFAARDDTREERLYLEGEALLEQDGASIRAERIVYLPETKRFHARGQPLHSILPLREGD